MTRRFGSPSPTMRIMSSAAMSTATVTPRRALLALAVSTMWLAGALQAQVRMTVPPQDRPVVLRGATIHTVTNGTITNGTIVFDRGKIAAIGGPEVATPTGAKVVDVSGKHIYPGLIDAYSTVGITEIGAVDVSNDINEIGDFNPNVRAEVAVNAESRHIGTTRSAGVLVTFSTPEGGVRLGTVLLDSEKCDVARCVRVIRDDRFAFPFTARDQVRYERVVVIVQFGGFR